MFLLKTGCQMNHASVQCFFKKPKQTNPKPIKPMEGWDRIEA